MTNDHPHSNRKAMKTFVTVQGICAWALLNIGMVFYMDTSWWSRAVVIGAFNLASAICLAMFFVVDWEG